MLFLLLACAPEETSRPEIRRSAPSYTTDSAENTTPPQDSGDSAPDPAPEDSDTPPEDSDTPPEDSDTPPEDPTLQVCYLGPDRDNSVCLDVVPWDSSFGSDYDYPSPYGGSAQYIAPSRYVDLDAVDSELEIAPNFVLSEYMEAWKGRYGVTQAHFVAVMQDMRDDLGEALYITSGYRNPAYNASVGGVSSSRHQYGDAADLYASSLSVEEMGDVCYAYGADYVGLYEDGHTHCDWRNHELDPAFYDSSAMAGMPAPAPQATLLPGLVWTAPATGFDEGEPLRRWRAWGADGALLSTTTGRTFVPPAGATRVQVVVGGHIILEQAP